ncbi:MAG: phosphoethanolamine transferase [Burkholderiaceae bacterium]
MSSPALPVAAYGRRSKAIAAWRPLVSCEALILAACLYFSLFCNAAFWKAAVPQPVQWTWAASLFVAATAVHALLLSLLVWPRTARAVLAVLVLVSALSGHYISAYGIYIDADMMRNVLHTDWREASELAGPGMLWAVLAALPALVVLWRIRVRPRRLARALLVRVLFFVAMTLVAVASALPSLQPLASFLRTQREVRYLATPANVLVSLTKVASAELPRRSRARLPIGEDAVQSATAAVRKPRLLLLVVGETARAANWGLNGYARQTTPALAARSDVLNFPQVTACGTSTEVSLPCMFSPWGRADYDEKRIRSHQSLLHVLQRAGVATLWRDNQSGCKGVCEGLPVEDLNARTDPGLCEGKRCYDAILLDGLPEIAARQNGDQVVVLHMLGNHGPTYFERYPPDFGRFTPVCETADLGRCSREQIVNAYDNALLYTDHLLAEAIDRLAALTNRDTALLYVSDHGESLGEKGLYLHGMPYAIAPDEQLRVPMVAWFSPGWRRSAGLDEACLRRRSTDEFSHDHLFHTVLGLTDVRTTLYRAERDIFLPCAAAGAAAGSKVAARIP